MSRKNTKMRLLLLSTLLIVFVLVPAVEASAFDPTVTDLSPNRAHAGQVVTVLGLSYREGSEVVFYQGAAQTARVALAPAPSVITNTVTSTWIPAPSSTEFTFTVPSRRRVYTPSVLNTQLHLASVIL